MDQNYLINKYTPNKNKEGGEELKVTGLEETTWQK